MVGFVFSGYEGGLFNMQVIIRWCYSKLGFRLQMLTGKENLVGGWVRQRKTSDKNGQGSDLDHWLSFKGCGKYLKDGFT